MRTHSGNFQGARWSLFVGDWTKPFAWPALSFDWSGVQAGGEGELARAWAARRREAVADALRLMQTMVGGDPAAFAQACDLWARGARRRVAEDMGAGCDAMARLAALTLGSIEAARPRSPGGEVVRSDAAA